MIKKNSLRKLKEPLHEKGKVSVSNYHATLKEAQELLESLEFLEQYAILETLSKVPDIIEKMISNNMYKDMDSLLIDAANLIEDSYDRELAKDVVKAFSAIVFDDMKGFLVPNIGVTCTKKWYGTRLEWAYTLLQMFNYFTKENDGIPY